MSEALVRSRTNLAEPRLGAEVVYASDEFFGACERLIDPAEPVFVPDRYDDHGKWMDGWESRRRRDGGDDHCVVRLGQPARVDEIEIDTRHFTGNYPPRAAVDGILSDARLPAADAGWSEIVAPLDLEGDSRRVTATLDDGPWSHLRLRIFPDGGVARLRVFGRFDIDWSGGEPDAVDLAALENGGHAIACSDEHYGRLTNALAPGTAANMGDGWETRRRRDPGHDFGIIGLGAAGIISEVVVDTTHFKGNYPGRLSLQASPEGIVLAGLDRTSAEWPLLLPEQELRADSVHRFDDEIVPHEPVRLVRINLIPDGGISRLRLFGRPA